MGIEELNIAPLEQASDNTANPSTECCYPQCEKCSKYMFFDGVRYCTVPMVVNKQIWHMVASKLRKMERAINMLEYEIYSMKYGIDNKRDDERELYDKTTIDLAGESP